MPLKDTKSVVTLPVLGVHLIKSVTDDVFSASTE